MAIGIDVSSHQGTVNWLEVKRSGQEFAVARCTIGRQTKDDTFLINYPRMVARGLIPGAYHLVTGDSTGAEQAANWKDTLDAVGFDKGLLVLDVEGWSSTLNGLEQGTLAATEYLCNWIRDTYGRTPIIYTGVYWRDNLKQHPNNFGSELWLSYYGTNDVNLYVPTAWKSKGWKIWQYTSSGTVPGVTGNVDMNRSAGTLESLQALAEREQEVTIEEIRAVVADEVGKAVVRIQATENANKLDIVTLLREVELRLANDIANNKHGEIMSKEDTLAKFAEVLDAVNAATEPLPEPKDYSSEFVALSDLVNRLHKHLCLPCTAEGN